MTTAMGVMPHTDVARALEMAQSLDVPFWPQLPNYSWGIVPTGFEAFEQEEIPSLIWRLEGIWKILWSKGVDREQLISRSMLSPATCCLVNPDKERTVERAFAAVNRMAEALKDTYQ